MKNNFSSFCLFQILRIAICFCCLIVMNGNHEVGKEVRNSIKRLGGTIPEDLPTLDKSLKGLERNNKKLS